MTSSEFILLAAAWLSGMFFGMGVEEKFLAPMRRKRKANGNGGCPEPLPVVEVEVPDRADGSGRPMPIVISADKENFGAGGVVVGNIGSVPPVVCGLKDSDEYFHVQLLSGKWLMLRKHDGGVRK